MQGQDGKQDKGEGAEGDWQLQRESRSRPGGGCGRGRTEQSPMIGGQSWNRGACTAIRIRRSSACATGDYEACGVTKAAGSEVEMWGGGDEEWWHCERPHVDTVGSEASRDGKQPRWERRRKGPA
ncbi:uncharacterized protein A4U43_C10F14970 [Asparagus officinalis]|uniref:Uncharacterized protein n=1 Tax=Asparagus officinalis TaxID=4686 RepID=A0A5P1E7M7_ASPOF|nr:uncharacterized protein A4U43_C10F14970 [Asparagus officinalis]